MNSNIWTYTEKWYPTFGIAKTKKSGQYVTILSVCYHVRVGEENEFLCINSEKEEKLFKSELEIFVIK